MMIGGNNLTAILGGFVLGSIVTGAAALIYYNHKHNDDDDHNNEKSVLIRKYHRQNTFNKALETTNVLKDLVARLWGHLNPALSQKIKEKVEPMFADYLPSALKSLHFCKFDLGPVPMSLDNVVVRPTKDGSVTMDVDVIWDGKADIQMKTEGRLVEIKLGIRHIKVAGRLNIVFRPLTQTLPCIGCIQYAFINTPDLDLDFTGIADVADLSSIKEKILTVIKDAISGVMVLPNRMIYKMDLNSDFIQAFIPPVGVARITAHKGRGFIVQKSVLGVRDDIPDVYLKVRLGNKTWSTSVKKNNLNPEWGEYSEFLLCDTDQALSIEAWDEDKGPLDNTDDFLGKVRISITDMLLAGRKVELELANEDDAGTGAYITVECDILPLVSNNANVCTTLDNVNCFGGVMTAIIVGAYDIPVLREKACSFVRFIVGSNTFQTGVVVDYPGYYDGLNPKYDCPFIMPLTHELLTNGGGNIPHMTMELWNGELCLGKFVVKSDELLQNNLVIHDTRKLSNDCGASIEFQLYLFGIASTTVRGDRACKAATNNDDSTRSDVVRSIRSLDMTNTDDYDKEVNNSIRPQKVRLTIVNGTGFKNKKQLFKKEDVPDVYCKIKFGSSSAMWRTNVIKNSHNPVWNESKEYSFFSRNQVINVEAWDANRKTDDHIHGRFRVTVGDLLLSGEKEIEVERDGDGIDAFVTLRIEPVNENQEESVSLSVGSIRKRVPANVSNHM